MSGIIEEISSLVKKYNVTPDRVQKSIAYLTHYGYLAKNKELTVADVFTAVEQFIAFFNLEPHQDILTPKVLKLMELPRCGHPDIQNSTQLVKWGQNSLTYFIANRVSGLPQDAFDNAVATAFANWSAVANLKIAQVSSQADANLVISIGSGAADNFPSLGVLAWAQLPGTTNYTGQLLMEFDNAEQWITDPNSAGVLIENVACHEFGHFLGLSHTTTPNQLMNAFYSAGITKPQPQDDIPKIQTLYGTPAPSPPTPPPPPPTVNELQLTVTQNPDGGFHFAIPGFRVMKV